METFREQLYQKILKANGKSQLPGDLDSAFKQLIAKNDASNHTDLATITDRVDSFKRNAEIAACEVLEVQTFAEIPALMSERVAEGELVVVSPQMQLQSLAWPVTLTNIERDAQWGIAQAKVGIAETGTLCLHSEEVASRQLYLVENLVLVINKTQIVARQEDAWRAMDVANQAKRALHLITGPSRTADVEQMLQLGAHGPRELLVVIVDNEF